MKMTNFILIDLTKIVTNCIDTNQMTVANYYASIGVPIPNDPESSPLPKEEGEEFNYLFHVCALKRYELVNKIWVNPTNGFIVAYEDYEGYKFSDNFIKHLMDLEPLNVYKNQLENILRVDSILDKISRSGIKSLTNEELAYLESNK